MIFILIFIENCLLYDALYDFSAWPRTISNPADINRFGSHIGKLIDFKFIIIFWKRYPELMRLQILEPIPISEWDRMQGIGLFIDL